MHQRNISKNQELPDKRRAELTFKPNQTQGRHGWLRLTPAYSVKLVADILNQKSCDLNVLDPFSGTATTPLYAAMLGHQALGLEINPFLVWFGNVKLALYNQETILQTKSCSRKIVELVRSGSASATAPPPIFDIERWWAPNELDFLCRLLNDIDILSPTGGPVRNLLLCAFCRSMISLSNAAFNHQSLSFKPSARNLPQLTLFSERNQETFLDQFLRDVDFILAGAAENPIEQAQVILADSRQIPKLFDGGIDLIVTSPPYPNRMSYIRELRPYMYWLGFLKKAREAGELDWNAIGGTWGIATSRVAHWRLDAQTYFPACLHQVLDQIRSSDAKSGELLSRYVGKYFEDIWIHLLSVCKQMKPRAEMHYIVGNSKFYEVNVPVELIFREMFQRLGVTSTEIIPLRKRNSKKELIEFDVVAVV